MAHKRYIYTVFANSIYMKSFRKIKDAKKLASELKKDGASRVKINREVDD